MKFLPALSTSHYATTIKIMISLFLLVSTSLVAQIPPKSKIIIVKGVSFIQVCSQLLDSGYTIEKKDNDLLTVRTEEKQYPKYWNAKYRINIRVKDSIAYISGTFTGADGGLFKDEPVYYHTNAKGKPYPKSLIGYPFLLINDFALSFDKPIEYKVE
jgi:hypothetical protein